MGVLRDAATGLDLREQRAFLGIELVDALHGPDIPACAILHIDTGFGDDRKTGHLPLPRLTVTGVASALGSGRPACASLCSLRGNPGTAEHPAEVDDLLLVDVVMSRGIERLGLRSQRHRVPAVVLLSDRVHALEE